jgi:hypothetical protein
MSDKKKKTKFPSRKVDQLRLQLHVSNLQLLVVLMARLNVVKLKDGLYNG